MIKLVVILVLAIHGSIHALGFAKAFGLAELPQLTQPISRPWGVVWGACALLFLSAAAAWIANAPWWWMLAAPALIASQVVIVAFWVDARLGTLANVALMFPVLVAFGAWRFAAHADAEVARLAARAPAGAAAVVEARETAALPDVVAAWLDRAGVVGRPRTRTLHLAQRGELQTRPGTRWMPFRAEQWVLVDEPAFLWVAHVEGRFGMRIAGRDRYVDGKGSMLIELLSLVPVVDQTGPEIDQGALVRFLAESIWYPSAALAPYLRWEAIDAGSARATMRYGGIEAAGVFRFDADGDPIGFEARRYREGQLEDWLIENDADSFRDLDGIRVPTRSTITWRNDAGEPWTWLRIEIVSAERNGEPVR